MKKLLATLLSFALICASGAAFAESVPVPGNKDIDVQAKYNDEISTPTVYSVDVVWGSMQFTYNMAGVNQWNPTSHEFDQSTTATWTAIGNTITVTNHSNAAVEAAFSFISLNEFSGVSGIFDNPTLNLASAAEGASVGNPEGAPSGIATLTLQNEIPNTLTSMTRIGTVTVTLSADE